MNRQPHPFAAGGRAAPAFPGSSKRHSQVAPSSSTCLPLGVKRLEGSPDFDVLVGKRRWASSTAPAVEGGGVIRANGDDLMLIVLSPGQLDITIGLRPLQLSSVLSLLLVSLLSAVVRGTPLDWPLLGVPFASRFIGGFVLAIALRCRLRLARDSDASWGSRWGLLLVGFAAVWLGVQVAIGCLLASPFVVYRKRPVKVDVQPSQDASFQLQQQQERRQQEQANGPMYDWGKKAL